MGRKLCYETGADLSLSTVSLFLALGGHTKNSITAVLFFFLAGNQGFLSMSATETSGPVDLNSDLVGVSGSSTKCVVAHETETVTEMERSLGTSEDVEAVSTDLGSDKLEGDLESVLRVKNLEMGLENLGKRVDEEIGVVELLPVMEGQEGCDGVEDCGKSDRVVENVGNGVSVTVASEELENQTVEGSLEVRTVDNGETGIDVDVSEAEVANPSQDCGAKTSEIMENQSIEGNLESKTEDGQGASMEGVSEISGDEFNASTISVDSDSGMDIEGNSKSGDEIDSEGTRVKDITKAVKLKRNGKKNSKVTTVKQYVPDIVWGKVRSHPWWPGLKFDPSAATKKAKKYYKKGKFLIAYFGDQTFAWNEASLIKPFSAHFSQMENQSNSEDFHHAVDCALDEVSRRVEVGLACSCLPEDLVASVKSQVIVNPGIQEESSRIDGGDDIFGVGSFEPAKLIQYIKALAKAPCCSVDRLEYAISQSQVLAIHRSKGYPQLPEFKVLGRLLEEDEEFVLPDSGKHSDKIREDKALDVKDEKQVLSGKEKLKSENGSGRKRKQNSVHDSSSTKKEQTLSELMASRYSNSLNGGNRSKKEVSASKRLKAVDSMSDGSTVKPNSSNGDNVCKKETDAKLISPSFSSKKHKSIDSIPDDSVKPSSSTGDNVSKKEVGAKLISPCPSKKRKAVDSIPDDSAVKLRKNDLSTSGGTKPKQTFRVGESILRVASQLNGTASILKCRDESILNNTSKEKPGAKGSAVSVCTPKNSEESPDTKFIPTEYCAPGEMVSRLRLAAKDPTEGHSFTISVVSFFSEFRSSVCVDPAHFSKLVEDAEGSQLEYLSSRMVPSNPDESGNCMPGLPSGKSVSHAATEQQFSGRTQVSEAVDPVDDSDEICEEEPSMTALILNFSNFGSVPSVTNLNRIYSQFGPLNESLTEVRKKSSRAKVVFKRRSDAESAFSSAGKYKIFGPSLVSYSLKYLPSIPSKASSHAKRRSKKDATSEKGNAT